MYKLRLTRKQKRKLLSFKWIIPVVLIGAVTFAVWFMWVRPIQQQDAVNSFESCKDAGYSIQETYPEVCLTSNGKRFINPQQAAAHAASQKDTADPVPPADPSQLVMPINEWGVQVPLTTHTYDLIYSYLKNNGDENVTFTYKRLINRNACQSGVGLTLRRSIMQHMAPFSTDNPAAVAHVGKFYYYVATDPKAAACYDPKNASQVTVAQDILQGQPDLIAATAALLNKLEATPNQ